MYRACLVAVLVFSAGMAPAIDSPASAAASQPHASPRGGAGAATISTQDAEHPSQSSVASKVSVRIVAPDSPDVKRALTCKDVSQADHMVGKSGSIAGIVIKAYTPSDHDIVILDFSSDYRNTITAIALPASYAKLPDLAALAGKRVLITGKIVLYERKPEFELTSADQISVIK